MEKHQASGRGFRYACSEEAIREYMALPPEMKLRWLAELSRFLHQALPPETKALQDKFRRGEV